MNTVKTNRINLYNNLKFLLIILVVVGHFIDFDSSNIPVFQSIFIYIYSFHMPLFIFVGGLFHKNENILKKCLKFITIGFLFKIINYLVQLIFTGNATFSVLSDIYAPWYMFALASFIAITYLTKKCNKRYVIIISLIIAGLVGYIECVGDFLYLSRIIVFYPFYLLGTIIDKEKLLKFTRKKWLKIFGLIFLIIWLYICFFHMEKVYFLRGFFTGRNSYITKMTFIKSGILYRYLSYIINIIIGISIICLIPNKKIPVITILGNKTLQVYFWHWPIVNILTFIGLNTILLTTITGKIIWLIIALILTFLLCLNVFEYPFKLITNLFNKVGDTYESNNN